MDSVAVDNVKKYEEKTEEMQLLVPNVPQVTIVPPRNDSSGQLKGTETPIRTRKSFCANLDITGSRRPSAVVSGVQQERRSSGNIFFEYVLT